MLGAVFCTFAYTFVGFFEAPRLWYFISCTQVDSMHPCYCLYVCTVPFMALFYVVVVVFCTPFMGLISGFMVGVNCAMYRKSEFCSDCWNNVVQFLADLDR